MQALLFVYCLLAASACVARDQRSPSVASSVAGSLESAIALSSTSSAEVRRIWTGDGADGTGSPSPDGTLLSYVDWSARTLNVRNVVTGEVRVVVRPQPSTSQFPEYSGFDPSGTRIAYAWFNDDGYELQLIAVNDGMPRVVIPRTADIQYIRPLSWTPDGKTIVTGLTRADGTSQLVLVNAATGSLRVLRSFTWGETPRGSAAVSPDGRYIAMGERPRDDLKSQVIVVASLDGQRQTKVVTAPGVNYVAGWSNDGRLFYAHERDGAASLYAVPIRNGRAHGASRMLKSDFGRAKPMALTRDGRLFYTEITGTLDVYVASIDESASKLLSPPSRTSHRLIGFNQGIDWTRDGRQTAYLVRKGATPNSAAILAVRNEQTGEVREVEPDLGYINAAIRWSPNGRSILAQGRDSKGRYGLHLIDPRTGQFKTIFHVDPKGGMVHHPAWDPDGNTIYYALWDIEKSKYYRIMRRDLRTDVEEEVYAPARFTLPFSLSADGSAIAVIVAEDSTYTLSVIPARGGEPRLLVRLPSKQRFTAVEFSHDGKQLLYSVKTDQKSINIEVRSVPVTGGEPRSPGLAMKSLIGLRAHPDGRRIGFTGGETSVEVWVLESGAPRMVGSR
jgi:Tol biopolymer transport system component